MEQHLKRTVNSETYEAIAAGVQNFEIVRGHVEIEPDDYCTYIEKPPADVDASVEVPRSVLRRVRTIVRTQDTDIPNDELARYGATVVGFAATEYTGLELLLQEGLNLIGFGLAKFDDSIEIIDGPSYLPPLNCPEIGPHEFLDLMDYQLWPNGHYSIMLQVKIQGGDNSRPAANVVDHIVMIRTLRDDQDVFTVVDTQFLRLGKIRDLGNNQVMPYIGSEQDNIDDIDTEAFEDEVSEEIDV